jgi:transposase-like protein
MNWLISSCDRKSAARTVSAMAVLLFALCIPQVSHGDAISQLEDASHGKIDRPANVNAASARIQWIVCPSCTKPIEFYNGIRPTTCPHCGYSFSNPTNSMAIKKDDKAAGNSKAMEAIGNVYTNKLNSVKVDAAVLKQQNERFNEVVKGQESDFEKEKSALLSIHTSMHTYVQDQKTNHSSYSTPKVRKLGPLSALSVEELIKRYDDDTAEIDRIVMGAKRRGENEARRQVTRGGDEANIQEAGENWNNEKKEFAGNMGFAMAGELAHEAGDKMAENAIGITDQGRGILGGVLDSSPNVAEQNQKDQSGSYDVVKSEGTYNQPLSPQKKSYNPVSSQDFKDGVILNEFTNVDLTTLGNSHHRPSNWDAEWKQAAASAEAPHPQLIASRDAPKNFNLSDAATVGETALSFAGPEAGLALTSGKFLIANGVALGNHSIYGNSVNQGTAFDEGSAQYANFYTQRLRDLGKDQEDIKAELAHRPASGGE